MRIVHYLNQFFGGIGGEDKADAHFTVKEGPVGPGRALSALFGDSAQVVATLICGDNTAQFYPEHVAAETVRHLQEQEADLLVAGPAFESGRYGLACAAAAGAAHRAGIPALVAMHPENPGVGLCPAGVPVVKAGENAADMKPTLDRVLKIATALTRGERFSRELRQLCVRRDIRRNDFADDRGASRAVSLLLQKIQGQPYESELRAPRFPMVTPAPPIRPEDSKIALVSTGGLVPKGNPDRLEASSATKWLAYSLRGQQALTPEEFECIHAGIDTSFVNADPNRLVPLDVCSEFLSKGLLGYIDSELYVTVGNLTPVAMAEQFAAEMAERLLERKVDGVILTST